MNIPKNPYNNPGALGYYALWQEAHKEDFNWFVKYLKEHVVASHPDVSFVRIPAKDIALMEKETR